MAIKQISLADIPKNEVGNIMVRPGTTGREASTLTKVLAAGRAR